MPVFFHRLGPALGAALLVLLTLAAPGARAQALPNTAAGGSDFSLCLHADGTLWAIGHNSSGQLGNGFTSSKYNWIQVGTDADWVQVAAGMYHSLALKANGTLYAWGANTLGQTGTGPASAQVLVPTAVPGGPYVQVAAGNAYSLALKADGTLYAWGSNQYGQLGNAANSGTTTANASPLPVGGGPYAQVAAGQYHALALTAGGALYAWGRNDYGQLGTGAANTTANPTPTRAGTALYVQAAAGIYHTLALRADGNLYAWGNNNFGQLGTTLNNGTYYPLLTPTLVSGGPYTQVAAGEVHSLALRPNGTLWGWGSNAYGEIGITSTLGSTGSNPTPVQVGTDTYARLGRLNAYHTLAARADGTLWATGHNNWGQAGAGSNTSSVTVPLTTTTVLVTRSTAVGLAFGLALRGDGALLAWGSNTSGQLGDGTVTSRPRPALVGTARDWVQVAAGDYHALALKADGSLWAWGLNANGQLGDNTTSLHAVPVQVSGPGSYVAVAAGGSFSLGLRPDGTLASWGSNQYGQLGDGTTTTRLAPVAVANGGLYTRVAAGSGHALALMPDGTAWAWGFNTYGQLGTGGSSNRPVPVPVSGNFVFTQVAAGNGHSLALMPDGTAWAWGLNGNGQLGSGNVTSQPLLVRAGSGNGYTHLAAGFTHSAARRADGTIFTWGANQYGQSGLGPAYAPVYTPTQEATAATAWAGLATGANALFTLARTASAQSFASTGFNDSGQLGDGTTATAYRFDRTTPLASLQALPVRAAAAGAALALVPNPAHGTVQVPGLAAGTTLAVYDALGRLVRPAAPAPASLDLAGLPPGVYLVRALAPDGAAQTARLVVE